MRAGYITVHRNRIFYRGYGVIVTMNDQCSGFDGSQYIWGKGWTAIQVPEVPELVCDETSLPGAMQLA